MTREQKFETFRALHERPGAFVIPNAWNTGTARILTALGFEALATTSAGHAFAVGRRDSSGALTRDERTRALLEQLYVYLLRAAQPDLDVAEVRTILFEVAGPQGREDVMNAGEQLRQEGREEALRGAIASVLMVRGLGCGEASKAKLAACKDVSLLTHWHTRAVTASSEAEVFADVGSDS